MKKIFLYIAIFFVCVIGIIAWFWPGVFSFFHADETSIHNETTSPSQAVTLSAEEKVVELEKKAIENVVVESQAAKETIPKSSLIEDVPFTVQAPFGEWNDPIFQNGCEEASLVMTAYWLSGKLLTPEIAKQEIIALSKYEKKLLGHSVDTSAEDTEKLLRDYYKVTTTDVRTDITPLDIQETLSSGAIVIVPADGRGLKNPHFTQPGPTTHMLVIIGYDVEKKEFIVNDPGTKHGKGYRYDENILYSAILDYPTGDHLPVKSMKKVMITIGKS